MGPHSAEPGSQVEIFTTFDWLMTFGERATLEGVLSQVRPGLSIEIGSAQGGSLARIAAHSEEVHAIDVADGLLIGCPANATLHEGDSKEVLPALLEGFAAQGRNVDFALVDGDHSPEGVEADLSNLLASPAISRTVILLHDSFSPWVRIGIEACAPQGHAKVVHCELDLVPGRMVAGGPVDGQLWGGFALVLVDAASPTDLPGIRGASGGVEAVVPTADAYEATVRAAPLIASMIHPEKTRHERITGRIRRRLLETLSSDLDA